MIENWNENIFIVMIDNYTNLNCYRIKINYCNMCFTGLLNNGLTCNLSTFRPNPTTIIPFVTNCLQVSSPMPDVAPVTTATLSAHFSIFYVFSSTINSIKLCLYGFYGITSGWVALSRRRRRKNIWGQSLTVPASLSNKTV